MPTCIWTQNAALTVQCKKSSGSNNPQPRHWWGQHQQSQLGQKFLQLKSQSQSQVGSCCLFAPCWATAFKLPAPFNDSMQKVSVANSYLINSQAFSSFYSLHLLTTTFNSPISSANNSPISSVNNSPVF